MKEYYAIENSFMMYVWYVWCMYDHFAKGTHVILFAVNRLHGLCMICMIFSGFRMFLI